MKIQVIVGNVGTVYDGTVYNGPEMVRANSVYRDYVLQSKSGKGRAAGENVTMLKNGEIHKEFIGENEE